MFRFDASGGAPAPAFSPAPGDRVSRRWGQPGARTGVVWGQAQEGLLHGWEPGVLASSLREDAQRAGWMRDAEPLAVAAETLETRPQTSHLLAPRPSRAYMFQVASFFRDRSATTAPNKRTDTSLVR